MPITTVSVVPFTLTNDALEVLLRRRYGGRLDGELGLPSDFVDLDQDPDLNATAIRVLREQVGLDVDYFIEQLETFSGTAPDPRGWSLSVVYYAVVPDRSLPPSDHFELRPVGGLPELPSDLDRIIAAAVRRVRAKSAYSSLPAFLLPIEFTLPDLQDAYERVTGAKLDKVSFRRKIEDENFLAPILGAMRRGKSGRPAQLYRLSERTLREFDRKI